MLRPEVLMNVFVLVLFALVVFGLLSLAFYFFQKRFWTQARNHSRTAPPSPPEGVGNKLGDHNPIWSPPKES